MQNSLPFHFDAATEATETLVPGHSSQRLESALHARDMEKVRTAAGIQGLPVPVKRIHNRDMDLGGSAISLH